MIGRPCAGPSTPTGAGITAALADQAKSERDRRAASYPAKIQNGADAEALCVDYQCWVAIAEWLETNRFFGFYGGIPPRDGEGDREAVEGAPTRAQPWIGWPELEAAAERAIASVRGDNEAAQVRRARLTVIHAKLARMRRDIDEMNAELRKPKEIAA